MFEIYNYSKKNELDRPQISEEFAAEISHQNMLRTKRNANANISSELVTEALISIINHKGSHFLEMTGEELAIAINGFTDYASKMSA